MLTPEELKKALDAMILSPSGWRKVFAPGGEEDRAAQPAEADLLLIAAAGKVFADWIREKRGVHNPVLLLGTDTRPTGPALAGRMVRALIASDCRVRYLGIAAAPEIMAVASRDDDVDGFVYISASHNPVGHNGLKFGAGGGGVLPPKDARDLIHRYRDFLRRPEATRVLTALDGGANPDMVDVSLRGVPAEKERALRLYRGFLEEVAGGPGDADQRNRLVNELRNGISHQPISVVADLNGSARTLSADRPYLEGLGIRMETIHDRPGEIAHAILPEGDSLEPCLDALEKIHAKDPAAVLGYVPDNDGDRGNLVVYDETVGRARILAAQEVFALTVLAELSVLAWTGFLDTANAGPTAVVVNGPTSLRIREIADTFGVEVHEVEVGEAVSVDKAAELRAAGYQVRIFGEGSNGGSITHPAAVRDPLNAVTALIKMIRLGSGEDSPLGLWRDLLQRDGRQIPAPPEGSADAGIGSLIASLPTWTTTPASESRAVMQVATPDPGELKTAWEEVFQSDYASRQKDLRERFGFARWECIQNEGTISRVGLGPSYRSAGARGGHKILFRDKADLPAGFLWMRSSGTEPVFRVLVDLRGDDPRGEKELLEWHRSMVARADRSAHRRGDHKAPGSTP